MSGLLGLLAMMMLNMGLDSLSSDDEDDKSNAAVGNDSAGITDETAAGGSLLDDLGDPPAEDQETAITEDNPLNMMDTDSNSPIAGMARDPAQHFDATCKETGEETIWGTTGDDSLEGTAGHDQIIAEAGDDTLIGSEGDDTLIGGPGLDDLQGGSGMDVLLGFGEDPATVAQTPEDLSQSDTLDGGAGNDSLYIGAGDIATGGEGGDSFITGEWVGDGEAPVITDFAISQDQLVVMYDPSDATAPEVAITSTAEGDLLVSLSGQTIARLVGDTTGFSLDNISLVAM